MTVRLGITDTVESVRQCIRIILTTSKGEVPFRPRFGLSAEDLLDGRKKDVDIIYAVVEQLDRYEKRIKVKKVVINSTDIGQKTVTIHYTIIAQNKSDLLTIQL
jgi:phage baseplate assembly protein W